MIVAVLHDDVAAGARADELDALVQARVARDALLRLGHEPREIAVGLDLSRAAAALADARAGAVLNLVETIGRTGRLIGLAPALVESLGLPLCGASSAAMFATSNKLVAKRMLRGAGLPTPNWVESRAEIRGESLFAPERLVLKSVWEHASVGLDEHSISSFKDIAALRAALAQAAPSLGGEAFAERFIDGREFNLSLMAAGDGGGVEVLPPAEIDFSGFPQHKPRIVGYRAKWDSESFEYNRTPRRFDFPPQDAALLDALRSLAKQCWDAFDLRGWARVDFRVDAAGRPWILEVNTNPCLSPDAGFAAALQQAGISIDQALARILADASMPGAARDSSIAPTGRVSAVETRILPQTIAFREECRPTDREIVEQLVRSTGFFHEHEIAVAVELIDERLRRGAASGYEFVFAEAPASHGSAQTALGYACFGEIACTQGSFDLYWIVVDARWHGRGVGRALLRRAEEQIATRGGRAVYVETSGRELYAPTRAFYESCGYQREAVLANFYAPGDDKIIYVRRLARA